MTEPSGFESQTNGTNPLEGASLDAAIDSINNVFADVRERFLPYAPGGQYAEEVAVFADRQAEQAGGESMRLDGLAEQGEPTELASTMVLAFAYGVSPDRIGSHFASGIAKHANALGLGGDPDKVPAYAHNVVQTMTNLDAPDGMFAFLQGEETGFTPVETAILESAALGIAFRRDPGNTGANALHTMITKYSALQRPAETE